MPLYSFSAGMSLICPKSRRDFLARPGLFLVSPELCQKQSRLSETVFFRKFLVAICLQPRVVAPERKCWGASAAKGGQ